MAIMAFSCHVACSSNGRSRWNIKVLDFNAIVFLDIHPPWEKACLNSEAEQIAERTHLILEFLGLH